MSDPDTEHDSGHQLIAELLGWSVEQVEDTGARLRTQFTEDFVANYTKEDEK